MPKESKKKREEKQKNRTNRKNMSAGEEVLLGDREPRSLYQQKILRRKSLTVKAAWRTVYQEEKPIEEVLATRPPIRSIW